MAVTRRLITTASDTGVKEWRVQVSVYDSEGKLYDLRVYDGELIREMACQARQHT